MTDKQLTAEEAYDVLVAQVHAPVFFEKLARVYNIRPQTEEDAKELLLMAARLRNAHEQETAKQASATSTFYAQANQALDATLNDKGFKSVESPKNEANVKAAAAEAVKNPLIKEAALVFGNYVNSQLQS